MTEQIRITHLGEHGLTKQPIVNIYNYETADIFIPSFQDLNELALSFKVVVADHVRSVLGSTYVEKSIEVFSWSTKVSGFSVSAPNTVGLRPGKDSVAGVAWSVKLQRGTNDTKSGGKRFSPIANGDVTEDNQLELASGISGEMDLLLAALVATITSTTDPHIFFPIIARIAFGGQSISARSPVASAIFNRASSQEGRNPG